MLFHFLIGLHFLQKDPMLYYVRTFIMFKHVNFGKHIEYISQKSKKNSHLEISSRDEVFTRFFLFLITGWIFISVFLTGMNSSRNETSSRQKYVNRKRHFTIDRDDFIPGRISSQEEVSRIKTIWMMILQRSISIVHKYYGKPILQNIYKFI